MLIALALLIFLAVIGVLFLLFIVRDLSRVLDEIREILSELRKK